MHSDHGIKRKGLLGIIYFLGNSSYAAALGLVANLIFTIFLSPAEYGLYFIVLSIIAIFNYFTDLGLAAALIQKKDAREEDFYTAFTIQFVLIAAVTALGLVLTPIFIRFYHLAASGIHLYLAMLFSLFLLSFKSVPSTRLERKLDYGKIVATTAVESTVFYGISIVMMLLGYRVYALVAAIVVRSLVGMSLIYWFTRWQPRFYFKPQIARSILNFGLPFQANVLLAFVKDDLLNLYMAQRLGLSGIGYVGWAKKWAEAALRIIMDNVNRVLFPVFSKFQDDPAKVKKGIEKLLFYNALVLMPILIGSYLTMPFFIQIIPKYQKWNLAMPAFNWFLISSLLVSFASPLISVFNSLGRVRISVQFMLLWIVLNWTVVPYFIGLYNYTGVGMAFALNACVFILVWRRMRQVVPVDFLTALRTPAVASLLMLVIVKFSQLWLESVYLNLAVTVTLGVAVYSITILALTRGAFVKEIMQLLVPEKAEQKQS